MMESKIVQIQTCVQNNIHVMTALCEDGSVWNSYDCNDWEFFEEPSNSSKNKEDLKNSTPSAKQQTHDAIALWCELVECLDSGKSASDWLQSNGSRINAVVTQQHHA